MLLDLCITRDKKWLLLSLTQRCLGNIRMNVFRGMMNKTHAIMLESGQGYYRQFINVYDLERDPKNFSMALWTPYRNAFGVVPLCSGMGAMNLISKTFTDFISTI